MKRADYGFSLVKFDKLMSLSVKSFAFPLHVEKIYFQDDLNNVGWKVVLRKEPRGARVVTGKDSMRDIACLILCNVDELIPQSLDNDATPNIPKLDQVMILSSDQVVVVLNTNEEEPSYEDECDVEIEQDENAPID